MLLERCPWYVAGPSIGLLLVVLRAALNKPFGALGGFVELVEKRNAWRRFGLSAFVLIGTILGGAVFAVVSGNFHLTVSYGSGGGPLPIQPIAAIVVLLTAGAVMGFGARLAGGCTSGHGLCGVSLGSPASVAATMTFFAAAVLFAHLFAWLMGSPA